MKIYNYNIKHEARFPWQFVDKNFRCTLRVDVDEKVKKIEVFYGDPFDFENGKNKIPNLKSKEMRLVRRILSTSYYGATIQQKTHKLRYHFKITLENGEKVILSELGLTDLISETQLRAFYVPYIYEQEKLLPNRWAKNFIWYQIFPDRFAKEEGETGYDKFIPSTENFFGGTLNGIIKKIPYLKSLGIEGVYLNPIFKSSSNHKYDTYDYSIIDPKLGSEKDFKNLVMKLHKNNMKIMLDGVYNHCGWDNPIWQDVLNKGENSRYFNWFYIYDRNLITKMPKSYFTDSLMKKIPSFECFAFASNMPKWNTENPEVVTYLIDIAKKWTVDYDIDAWRLDVPDEVNCNFLKEFKKQIHAINPSVYIIGEIWQNPEFWLTNALFDGVMNYSLYFAIRDFSLLRKDSIETFAKRLDIFFSSLPNPLYLQQFTFCSNHDVPRALFLCDNKVQSLKQSYFLAALLGGNLSIYYGDEIALTGAADPDNRRAMDWNKVYMESDLLNFFKELINFKKMYLSDCHLKTLQVTDYILMTLDSSKYEVLIYITQIDNEAIVSVSKKYGMVFGSANRSNNVWKIQGFAAFVKEIK